MANEITQMGLTDCTYVSDDGNSSQFDCIIQVIFDQHLQVDVETTGGHVFEDIFVRPYGDFVYLNKMHFSGSNESIKGSVLVPVNQIASIRFRDDHDYVQTEPR